MTDDRWRDRREADDFSEYGSLFDDAEPTQNVEQIVPTTPSPDSQPDAELDTPALGNQAVAGDTGETQPDDGSGGIIFGDSDTGPLPHWTEPPTGEVPRFDAMAAQVDDGDDEDVDVWSSFSSESPVWKDDQPVEPAAVDPDPSGPITAAISGQQRRVVAPEHQATAQHDAVSGQHRRVSEQIPATTREPSRITIGTDPSGMPRSANAPTGRRRGAPPAGPRSRSGQPQASGRDMPTAIAVGLVIAAAFIGALMYKPVAAAALITIILGLAAIEFYDKVAEKGYRPAVVPGIVACVSIPLAAYWLGDATLPLAMSFGFMVTAASFIGARNVESGPMPNVAITTLGIVWIGVLGSFAMLILRFSTNASSLLPEAQSRGTDTLFLLAIGVVANDVGALFVGSAAGRTPLRPWISPNKTVEGFIGGAFMTLIALLVVGIGGWSTTWVSYRDLVLLAILISILAPMGDLVESMFKRNLDVKDFGSIVKGHGGVLDRFDGFLFALPGVYYLTLVIEPWLNS